jgi:hypothetical protein
MNPKKTCIRRIRAMEVAVVTMMVTMMAMAAPSQGADTFSHKWWRVGFETPIPFSEPIRLGLGAVALVNPPENGLGQGLMEITLVAVPKDMQESMGNDDKEILSYVKSTFLGTAKPAESDSERSFMGQASKGGIQKTTIPKPGELEIHLVALSDGDKVAVGLTRDANAPVEDARRVMDMLARTFKEIPEE